MPIYMPTPWDRLFNLEKRLWEQARREEARSCVDLIQLSEDEDARLHQLWEMRDEGLDDAEQEELYALLWKCRIGCSDDIDEEGYEEDEDDEVNTHDHNGDDVDQSGLEQLSASDEDADGDDVDEEDEDDQDQDTMTDWDPITLAFVIAFHRYAFQHPEIALLDWDNLLHAFLILTGCRLLEKYGWIVDQNDFSRITPLGEWRKDDRMTLVTLYQRYP